MIPKKTPRGERALPRRILIWLLGGAAVALIALSGTVHQLLLFYLSTLFIGVTSCVLFLVVWQSKSVGREAFYLIIATASLCIGALECALPGKCSEPSGPGKRSEASGFAIFSLVNVLPHLCLSV